MVKFFLFDSLLIHTIIEEQEQFFPEEIKYNLQK